MLPCPNDYVPSKEDIALAIKNSYIKSGNYIPAIDEIAKEAAEIVTSYFGFSDCFLDNIIDRAHKSDRTMLYDLQKETGIIGTSKETVWLKSTKKNWKIYKFHLNISKIWELINYQPPETNPAEEIYKTAFEDENIWDNGKPQTDFKK